jgi:hypothetical protein
MAFSLKNRVIFAQVRDKKVEKRRNTHERIVQVHKIEARCWMRQGKQMPGILCNMILKADSSI